MNYRMVYGELNNINHDVTYGEYCAISIFHVIIIAFIFLFVLI